VNKLKRQIKIIEELDQKGYLLKTRGGGVLRNNRIIIDSGSTTSFLPRYLKDMNLTVLTNSLIVVHELSWLENINLIVSGGEILVLHAGYTLDGPVFTESTKRKKVLEEYEKQSSFLWLKKGSICKPGYVFSDEYKIHMEETLKNLKEAANICMDKGIRLAVENLNPRLTYLFQIPEDFIRLTKEIDNIFICVDIGHLWISALVQKLYFLIK